MLVNHSVPYNLVDLFMTLFINNCITHSKYIILTESFDFVFQYFNVKMVFNTAHIFLILLC